MHVQPVCQAAKTKGKRPKPRLDMQTEKCNDNIKEEPLVATSSTTAFTVDGEQVEQGIE